MRAKKRNAVLLMLAVCHFYIGALGCSANKSTRDQQCSRICEKVNRYLSEEPLVRAFYNIALSEHYRRLNSDLEMSNSLLAKAAVQSEKVFGEDVWMKAVVCKEIASEYFKGKNVKGMLSVLELIEPYELRLEMSCRLIFDNNMANESLDSSHERIKSELLRELWGQIKNAEGVAFPLSGKCGKLGEWYGYQNASKEYKAIVEEIKQSEQYAAAEIDLRASCLLQKYYDEKQGESILTQIEILDKNDSCRKALGDTRDSGGELEEIIRYYSENGYSKKSQWIQEQLAKGPPSRSDLESLKSAQYFVLDFQRYSAKKGNLVRIAGVSEEGMARREEFYKSKNESELIGIVKKTDSYFEKGFLLAQIVHRCNKSCAEGDGPCAGTNRRSVENESFTH